MKWSKKIFQEGNVEFTESVLNYEQGAAEFVKTYHYSKSLARACSGNTSCTKNWRS